MALHLTVTHKDGTETKTQVSAATEVAFEAHFNKAWSEAFTEDHPRSTYIYYAAWHSITEDKKTALPFEEWIRTLESFEVDTIPPQNSNQVAPPG
jgi:hypothetical protein